MLCFFHRNCFLFSHGKKAWFLNHVNDEFVRKAQLQNYRSRAAFKLLQINEKYPILKNSKAILDLGSSPGSWSQVIRQLCPQSVGVAAVDLLPMKQIKGVRFWQGDARNHNLQQQIKSIFPSFDTIVSDMAPNFTGTHFQTHQEILQLNKLCLRMCIEIGSPHCNLAMKTVQGESEKGLIALLNTFFNKVIRFKPKSSRTESVQYFLICQSFKQNMRQDKSISKIIENIDLSRCRNQKQVQQEIEKGRTKVN